jgi:hypothetical protein
LEKVPLFFPEFLPPVPPNKNYFACLNIGFTAQDNAYEESWSFLRVSYDCRLKLFWNNKIKEAYWKMSPFVRKAVKEWAKKQIWDKLVNEYLDLYNNAK